MHSTPNAADHHADCHADHDGCRAAWLGGLAGLVATVPMTVVMAAIHRNLPMLQRWRPLPPEQITLAIAEKTAMEDHLDRSAEKLVTGVGHFGYGAVCGAAYGLYADRTHAPDSNRSDPLVSGAAVGLAVWAASYLGWLPAFEVRRSATKEHAGTNFMMITSHVVWGVSTAIAYDALRKKANEQRKHEETGVALAIANE